MPRQKRKKDRECQHCRRLFTSIGISKHEAACENVKNKVMQGIQYRIDRMALDEAGK
jgi:PHP family Zn ribbon phosphoesterase